MTSTPGPLKGRLVTLGMLSMHVLGIFLIAAAYRATDTQITAFTSVLQSASTIRISVERATSLLQQQTSQGLAPNQRARVVAELDRARLAASALMAQSNPVEVSLEPNIGIEAQRLSEEITSISRDLQVSLQNPRAVNLERRRSDATSLRRHLNALDDAVAAETSHRRIGFSRMFAFIMAGIGLNGSAALWSIFVADRRRLRAGRKLIERDDQLQALVGAVPDVIVLVDRQLNILASSSTHPTWRLSRSAATGPDPLTNALDSVLVGQVRSLVQECIQSKQVMSLSYKRDIEGKTLHFDSRCSPLRGREQAVWVSWDISARVFSEHRVRTLGRYYNFLSHVNQAIVWVGDEDSLIDRICSVATQHGDFAYAWFATRPPGRFGLHATHLVRASGSVDDSQHVSVLVEHPQSPLLSAINSQSVVCLSLNDNAVQASWRAHLMRLGLPGLVMIPVRSDYSEQAITLGVLVLHSREQGAFDEEHQVLFNEIAGDVAYAIGRIRRDAERQQMAGRVRLHATALDATRDGVLVTNPQGVVLSVNRAFSKITGISEHDAIGKISFLRQMLQESGYTSELIEQSLRSEGFWKGEILGQLPSGRMHTLGVTVSRVTAEKSDQEHRVVVFSDLTQQREDEARLRRVAQFDPLTGLPNRSLLLSRLEHALLQPDRQKNALAILYIDLDSFRTINDSLGHHHGDELLRQVALRLSEHTPLGCTLARMGGDEFALLGENLANADMAMQIARELHRAMDEQLEIAEFEPVYVQASIGICVCPPHQGTASDLIRNAELAMFEAKRAGRNAIRFFTLAMGETAVLRLAIETRLRRALAEHEFVLHYQPLWGLSGDSLVGVEALVRLNQPTLPPLGPAEFIPVLEDIGQIEALGDWVTREACSQAGRWLNAGWDFGVMAINLSPVEVARHPVEQRIKAALDESGIAPERIELEITESGLMEQGERAEDFLKSLHALGVRIAIDDFGTGYSSLAYLRRFPVNKLKIDRSFISALTTDERNARLVDSMLQLGRSLGIEVLAEGVETPEQADYLREHGCETIQGYYISPPLTAEQIWTRFRTDTPC